MKSTTERQDLRPLFKRTMGSGYIKDKAKHFRVHRDTISNILGGITSNPEILNECLAELEAKMSQKASALERIQKLMQTHQQLQNIRL